MLPNPGRNGISFAIALLLVSTLLFMVPLAQSQPANAMGPDVSPPDKEGPHKVGWYLVSYEHETFGKYNAIIYYPAEREGWRAKKSSGGPYPGIVVSNGYYGSAWNITWIPRHLASHGYVALAFTPPEGGTLNTWTISGLLQSFDQTQWAVGFNGGIDELKHQNQRIFSPIRDLVDTDIFGIIGLSMGGAGAIEAAAGNPNIDAVVGLAPGYLKEVPMMENCDIPAMERMLDCIMADLVAATSNVSVPTQLQVGTHDGFVKPEWVHELYADLLPSSTTRQYIEITGGSHAAYLDSWIAPTGDAIERLLGGGNQCGVEAQHNIAAKYFTAWFQYYLKGLESYFTYLYGKDVQIDSASGVLAVLESNGI